MKFGVDIPTHGPYSDPHLLLDLASEAEEAGWDGVFLWDHITLSGKSPHVTDPWIVLAGIAIRTTRIRLGTMITPVARRRPWKLARETAALDQLSGGRLILGVGLGALPKPEFAALGEDPDPHVRAAKLDEGLEILELLWSGNKVSFSGEHYTLTDVQFLPTPIQQPRIPVWVGGYWPHRRPMRRAAYWDGVFPLQSGFGSKKMMEPDTLIEIVDYISQHRTNNSPFDLVHWGLSFGDPIEDAGLVDPYKQAGVTWWLENINPGRGSVKKMQELIRRGPPRLA